MGRKGEGVEEEEEGKEGDMGMGVKRVEKGGRQLEGVGGGRAGWEGCCALSCSILTCFI
jgi:hypothetical protein